MSKKSEERDEEGLTADERAIIDSIDFDKIVSDVTSKQDEIVEKAVKKAKEDTRKSSGKTKLTAVAALVLGTLFLITGIISLSIEMGIYFLIAAALFYVFGICLFAIARSNKKFASE